jgi:hypothetical protein
MQKIDAIRILMAKLSDAEQQMERLVVEVNHYKKQLSILLPDGAEDVSSLQPAINAVYHDPGPGMRKVFIAQRPVLRKWRHGLKEQIQQFLMKNPTGHTLEELTVVFKSYNQSSVMSEISRLVNAEVIIRDKGLIYDREAWENLQNCEPFKAPEIQNDPDAP